MDWLAERLEECRLLLNQLLSTPKLPSDDSLRSSLPERPGIYAIHVKGAKPGEILRAGRTKSAAAGLRQRIYQNHLMGDQAGNLRAQLVSEGQCVDLDQAKKWIRVNCLVQVLVVEDNQLRQWSEHFILSVLRPRYSD